MKAQIFMLLTLAAGAFTKAIAEDNGSGCGKNLSKAIMIHEHFTNYIIMLFILQNIWILFWSTTSPIARMLLEHNARLASVLSLDLIWHPILLNAFVRYKSHNYTKWNKISNKYTEIKHFITHYMYCIFKEF